MTTSVINDMSIDRQYADTSLFLEHLKRILSIRIKAIKFNHHISCSRNLRYRFAHQDRTVVDIIYQIKDQPLRNLALAWITKGPYWVSPAEGEGITYFHLEDVTEQGLGEAARRRWLGEDARAFSFEGIQKFEVPILEVECIRDHVGTTEITTVPNDWSFDSLEKALPQPIVRPGWHQMLDRANSELNSLYINYQQAISEMARYPYDQGASDRIFGILRRLNDLSIALRNHGENSPAVIEWLRVNVMAKGADFSSEDPENKKIFLFRDPGSGSDIYCPWHGKVHNPLQYRIHFQWPVPENQEKIKVLYIGQKLTKS
ncbi:hypothetical protein [Nitrospirillum viridazoti]|uniref:hypothetical protein n=1 Tax=Nitrospirillum viridazoti TaxID=3144925 RepID=UPI00119F78F6|nr:hypothetical protein [Nitrospirillum amazonense]TWB34131.1 hypothetical protein FBZ91_11226 [Nitrospirillum amazonense]